MTQELRKLFDRYEIYAVITAGLAMSLLSLLEIAASYTHTYFSAADAPSAYQAAMIYSGQSGEIFGLILLPVFAVLPYMDSYRREKQWGILPCALTRQTRSRYLWEKASAVLLSAWLAILLPYVINQALCLIAFPAVQTKTFLYGNPYSNSFAEEILHTPTPGLYMNNQFMLNCAHIGYACLYGGSVAFMGYASSLFTRASRAVTNLVPVAVSFIGLFVGMYAFGSNYTPALAVRADPFYSLTSFAPSLLIILFIYAACAACVVMRCSCFKDELR